MSTIEFTIPGTPVGKGRPAIKRRKRRDAAGKLVDYMAAITPEKTVSYENLVKVKAEEAMRHEAVIAGAVEVGLFLFVVPPASWSAKKRAQALQGQILPTTKPDIDNVAKGIFDACNGIVWGDDKQVVDVLARKRYAEVARVIVKVKRMENFAI